MDREVVKELIQDELTVKNLQAELNSLLNDENRRKQLSDDYGQLKLLLSEGGHASENAAKRIMEFLTPVNDAGKTIT
jgi:lipid-A-disaccharide synthase